MNNFFDSVMILIMGLMLVSFGYWIKGKEGVDTLRLTQNSEFVVENVRADSTGWEYTLKTKRLTNFNLTRGKKINTLIVETDKPIGYAVGDTLHLLQHGEYSGR